MWATSASGWRGWRPCSGGATAALPAHQEIDSGASRRRLRIADGIVRLVDFVPPA